MALHVHSCVEDWHSMCCRFHCSTPTIPKLTLLVSIILIWIYRSHTFIKSTSSKVKTQVRLSVKNFTPLHKLVGSKLVRLCSKPSQLGSVNISALDQLSQYSLHCELTGLVVDPWDQHHLTSDRSRRSFHRGNGQQGY